MTALSILQQGPFPQHIDPWLEQGRYFHPLHEHMITYLVDQTQEILYTMGYVVGRETSLQIAEKHLPDIYLKSNQERPPEKRAYSETATALNVETGIAVEDEEPELDAFVVYSRDSGDLVTLLEIISPSNKVDISRVNQYISRRQRLLQRQVHVVELDLTRSILRLNSASMVNNFPYHIMIYLHDEQARFLGIALEEAPKRFALPLHGEGIAIELNRIYREAYAKTLLSWHIQNENRYNLNNLPFPSTLNQNEIDYLLKAVKNWQATL